MAAFPISRYVATLAATVPTEINPAMAARDLALCDRLGQLIDFAGGFVAWLRCEWASLPRFQHKRWEDVWTLTDDELTQGPVVYFTAAVSLIPHAMRPVIHAVERLPGVEALAAHLDAGARWQVDRLPRTHPAPRQEQYGTHQGMPSALPAAHPV